MAYRVCVKDLRSGDNFLHAGTGLRFHVVALAAADKPLLAELNEPAVIILQGARGMVEVPLVSGARFHLPGDQSIELA